MDDFFTNLAANVEGAMRDHVVPVAKQLASQAQQLVVETVSPAAEDVFSKAQEIVTNEINPRAEQATAAIQQAALANIVPAVEGILPEVQDFFGGLVLPSMEEVGIWIQEHPLAVACIALGLGLILLPDLVSELILVLAGFGINGVIDGSLAAALHSILGNVATGSIFAVLQSAGAGGGGAAIVQAAAQGVGALMAAAGVALGAVSADDPSTAEDLKPDKKKHEEL